ncbi:glutathione S-transferase family protein [Elioraea rosea]|uniref:glutathione S-transferase family protein n=1 Tax=Elioraea rosea TaxID=2492390 RepID=UPI001181CC72|nr:glutathione S-transferase family protein [Elioraea rosea]
MPRPVLWTSMRTTGTVARLMLAEARIDHETRFLSLGAGEHRKPAYLAVNPKGQVPALALEDGSVLTENIAIALHVGLSAPDSGLVPADPLAMARTVEWLSWGVCTIVTAWQPRFMPGRFTDGGESAEAALAEAATARAMSALDIAEAALEGRETLLGDRPTAADLMLFFNTTIAARLGLADGRWPNLAAHRARIAARPAVAPILAEEGLA